MKIISYNVNGIRASLKAGLEDFIKSENADIVCIQEVRCDYATTRELLYGKAQQSLFIGQDEMAEPNAFSSYFATIHCGERKGYAGTMTLSKDEPDRVILGMGEYWDDKEGRTTTTIFKKLAIVNTYVPNGNSRLFVKLNYLAALIEFVKYLSEKYEVIVVGDFNIAHNEIDISHPDVLKTRSVFLPIERKTLGELLDLGLTDSFRFLNPESVQYSWRSYRKQADPLFNGWQFRIDYILTSKKLDKKLEKGAISEQPYSDHLPAILEMRYEL